MKSNMKENTPGKYLKKERAPALNGFPKLVSLSWQEKLIFWTKCAYDDLSAHE